MWDMLATNTSLLGPLGGGFQERQVFRLLPEVSTGPLAVKADTTVSQCKRGAGGTHVYCDILNTHQTASQ